MADRYAQMGSDEGRGPQETQNIAELVKKEMEGVYDSLNREMSHFNREQSSAVKASVFVGPGGIGLLLFATFLAGQTLVCQTSCIRTAELREERLLDCEEKCIQDPEKRSSCKDKCASDMGYSRNRVRRSRDSCTKACDRFPWLKHMSAAISVFMLLVVTPLLGSYKNSCGCECCRGEGCSARLALLNVGWGFFAMGCLWTLPAVVEDSGELGGKVMFGLSHLLAIGAMWGSRAIAEKAERLERMKAMRAGRAAGGGGGGYEMASIVGQPTQVSNPEVQELREKVAGLQGEYQELKQQISRLAGGRSAEAVPAVVSAAEPPRAVAAAPARPPLLL